MATRALLSILFSVSLLIRSVAGDRQFFKLEELNKPKQLQHQKRPVKTIKTEHGDVYDCIDFYEQPAFDHPALKKHNFYPGMKPSSRPEQIPSSHTSNRNFKPLSIGLMDKPCPYGTVPIRRVDGDDHIQLKSFSKNNNSTKPNYDPAVTFAIARTKSDGVARVYHGVGANLSVHTPLLLDWQYSSGQVGIQGGSNSIRAGWTVNPILYKDHETRMFIYTSAGASHCFNTYCPGFVIVREDFPLDSPLASHTQPRGSQSYFSYFIYQDEMNGNWWLEVGSDYTPIGFWPKAIFTDLAGSGSSIECGGEVYLDPSKHGAPNMGTSYKPGGKERFNAYCFGFIAVDEEHKTVMAENTEPFTTWDVYGVLDKYKMEAGETVKDHGRSNINITFEHLVIYGGPDDAP